MVCPYDLARPGGVQGQARGLASALRAAGHEVLVVAPVGGQAGHADGVYAAGRALAVAANGSQAPLALSPAAAARAHRAVARWGADVVHLHEPLAPVLGYGFVLSRRWPTVATFHRSGVGGGLALAAPVARWAGRRLDVRCAVSDAARSTAEALSGPIDEVLFNGVDLTRFSERPASPRGATVLFLGRHEPRKGLAVLLEAFSALAAAPDAPAATLWVAGGGPETESLRARYPESDRVRWLGILSDEEVVRRLSGAAVLCAPSLGGESFGMVLVEAMAAGAAVVASDIPGYRDAAAGHARLVPPGDAGALGAALARTLAEGPAPEARRRASEHAAAWSMTRLAARYVELYGRAAVAHGGIVAGR